MFLRTKFIPAPIARIAATFLSTAVFAGVASAAGLDLHGYVALDSMPYARVSDAVAARAVAPSTTGFRGAVTLAHDAVLIDGSERTWEYDHHANAPGVACLGGSSCNTVVGHDFTYRAGSCPGGGDPGCVTVIGHGAYEGAVGSGMVYAPSQSAVDRDDELHLALRAQGSLYAGVGVFQRTSNYLGYPKVSGLGYGLSLQPNFAHRFSPYGSIWYYPHVKGKYDGATSVQLGSLSGATFTSGYRVTSYELGAIYSTPKSPLFVGLHISGEHAAARDNSPVGTAHDGFGITVGLHR